MDKKEIQAIIAQGEGIGVEFKKAENALPKNLFDSICAFLNHTGGSIILGVEDNKNVVGVNPLAAEQLCKEISNLSNNSNKLNPVFLLQPEIVDFDDKKLIYLFVPASSQVHQSAGNIFDRSSDGDFIVKSQVKISELYLNKSTFYSENTIYPYLNESHFDQNTVQKAKNLIRNNRPDHPWLALSTEDFYRMSGLYRHDISNNTEGFTMAALLLFGKEEIIQSALPYYRIDAILRKIDIERYDDRITVCCNLIEASEKLMQFVAKHLPDPFYLEGTHRISLRDNTFREIIANSLIHREYLNPKPSLIAIYSDRVIVENANKPYLYGRIDPLHYHSFPKNPRLTLFFVQMAMAEALGTGIRKITRFAKLYTGKEPIISDEDMFRVTIPLPEFEKNDAKENTHGNKNTNSPLMTNEVSDVLQNDKVSARIFRLLQHDQTLSIASIAQELSLSKRTIMRHIQQLKQIGLVSKVEKSPLWIIPKTEYEVCHKRQDCHDANCAGANVTDANVTDANHGASEDGISRQILSRIYEDCTLSAATIAQQMNLSTRTIQIHIQRLVRQGLLARVEKQTLWTVHEETHTAEK